jgi:phosphinothricin acetyltransferase
VIPGKMVDLFVGRTDRHACGMEIRPCTETDLAEVQSIYAHHVLYGTGTFEEVPPSVEEMGERFRHVAERGWAWLVAADATGVLGYAYFAQFRDRTAYRFTAEDSIYVREDVRGQGVGKALVAALLDAATADGFRQMIAVIGDSENVGSIGVHASLGFRMAGTLRVAGLKFGRWLDVIYMQRALGNGDADVPS